MARVRVAELEGSRLDAAVTLALGQRRSPPETSAANSDGNGPSASSRGFSPSTRWRDGGPIIENERIKLVPRELDWSAGEDWWHAQTASGGAAFGPTALMAAMRAYLDATFGEALDLPPE